jgi:hypothetical protein
MPQFLPGTSGNPAGRPRGMTSLASIAKLRKQVPAILDVLLERALAGDSLAATVLLERAMAPVKAKEEV